MGSESIASVASVPVSKSSAASSYDIFSKTDAKQMKIDYENLPIKNFTKYSIACLKDGSDEQMLAGLGICTLNLFGLFTDTRIDYPEHWFLIAKATNWTNDIDNIISIGRKIINSTKNFFVDLKDLASVEGTDEKTNKVMDELMSLVIRSFIQGCEGLKKEYSERIQNYFSKNDENEFNVFCKSELTNIYSSITEGKDPKEISEKLDNLEKWLKEKESKVYYLIEKGEGFKGITKYDSIDEILQHEKNNYHNNKVDCCCTITLKEKIVIKDIDDYINTLSDSYNLIDDNCQTFVRNILNHFT